METSVLLLAAAVVGLVLVAVLVVLLRGRAESRRALAAAAAESAELRTRLEALTEQLGELERVTGATRGGAPETAYLITDAGVERPEPTVPDRVVLSATVGEPLVKVVAFGAGLRRALSAESRNRIRFEMRREVRSARRRRRREAKDLLREARATQRAAEDVNAA